MKVIISFLFILSTTSQGLPPALTEFCNVNVHDNLCRQNYDCKICHIQNGPTLNPYGNDLIQNLMTQPQYNKGNIEKFIVSSITGTYDKDSDADGVSNKVEISAGSLPGDSNSKLDSSSRTPIYSPELAFQRVAVLYCGTRASYGEKINFEKSSDKSRSLHSKLQSCLESNWWKKSALRKLADPRIKPMKALGLDGSIVLADYEWDYRLFSYVLSGDRDFRDLLLADYHIDESGVKVFETIPPSLFPRSSQINNLGPFIVLGTGQPLERDKRLGMITSQWFLTTNTMFSKIPRTTAAQALRAYLGLDLAKSEGMHPIQGEPRDLDQKGVKQAECAFCHATLDPLSYTLSNYRGIETDFTLIFSYLLQNRTPSGTYDQNRTNFESQGSILGQKVTTPSEWATVAANSIEFRRNILNMFFEYSIGKKPQKDRGQSEFDKILSEIPSMNFQAEKIIHALIDTTSFAGVIP